MEEVKKLKRVGKSSEVESGYTRLTGLTFLANGSFVSYDKDKSITMFEEKRTSGGGCACC